MKMPLMPLNTVLFPGMPMPLAIMEERYLAMIAECLQAEEPFGVVLIRSGPEVGGLADPHEVGTTAQVVKAVRGEDQLQVMVVGRERFRVHELLPDGDLLRAEVSLVDADPEPERISPALCTELSQMLSKHIDTILELLGMPGETPEIPEDPERLSFMIAAHLTASLQERQRLLELGSVAERLLYERELLAQETRQYRLLLASFQRAQDTQRPMDTDHDVFSRN
jgi:uncharacterized protein